MDGDYKKGGRSVMKIFKTIGNTMLKTVVVCTTIVILLVGVPFVYETINGIIEEREKMARAEYVGSYSGVSPTTEDFGMTLYENGEAYQVGGEGTFEEKENGFIFIHRFEGLDIETKEYFKRVGNYFYSDDSWERLENQSTDGAIFDENGKSSLTVVRDESDAAKNDIKSIEFKEDGTFILKYIDEDYNEANMNGTYRLDGEVLYLENITPSYHRDSYVLIYQHSVLYTKVYEK